MKFNHLFIFIAISFLFFSCSEEEISTNENLESNSIKTEQLNLSNLSLNLSKMSIKFDGILLENFASVENNDRIRAINSFFEELESIKETYNGDTVNANIGVLNNTLVVSSVGIYQDKKLVYDFSNPEYTPHIGGPAPPALIASCPKGSSELDTCVKSSCVAEAANEFLSENVQSNGDCAGIFVVRGFLSASVCGTTDC
ncbi:hypothetical protein [Mesonia aestuariivivens]|uniref:Uncharacterized protein n=1 Tax=Mesonia aestuariivivens TaxID=2796128 RepID=A0ABS6W1D0_9FLAO|nr:hypothetical protein [Mesonia aestuariivivens]MBW2961651.1 hypothetical protein [Mesonia aestuariivivens]